MSIILLLLSAMLLSSGVFAQDSSPTVSNPIPDQTANEDDSNTSILLANVFTDVDNDDSAIYKTVFSNSNSSLVTTSISIIGDTLTLDFQADQNGSATITVRGTSNGLIVDDSFTVTVTAVNDAPSFNKGSDITVYKNSGTYSTVWADSISAGPSDESSQSVTFTLSNNNSLLFSSQPAISSSGTLTFTPVSDSAGVALVAVSLYDDGGTSSSSDIDNYPLQTFTITVQELFSTHIISNSITRANSVCTADLNNNGEMDVLSISQEWSGGSIVYWHKNNGDGSFETEEIKQFSTYIHEIIASDLDGDGDMDVLHAQTGEYDDPIVSWYKNNGDGIFNQIKISYDHNEGAHNIYTTDLDRDGDMDIITNHHGSSNILWHENDGNENFTQHIIDDNSQNTRSITASDIDGDGDLDVIGTSWRDANRITWYRNDGNENFTPIDIYASTEFEPNSIDVIDLDEDGYMDIISAANNDVGTQGKAFWFEHIVGDIFATHEIMTLDERFYNIKAADIDGDGDIDIILSQNWRELGWYQNNGSGNFVSVGIAENLPANSFYISDLDGDGDIDIASVNENDQVAWHENFSTCSSTYDCAGECGGSEILGQYYYDYDGDAHGSSISAGMLCSNHQWVKNGFVVSNKSDSYNDCTCPANDSTCLDVCGDCNGGASNAADCFQSDANWVFCSMEGDVCSFSGRREVRYGVINCDGQIVNEYVSGRFNNNVLCDSDSFGVEDICSGTQKYCIYSTDIYGCTDQSAIDYNPSATSDDGSCCLSLYDDSHCADDVNILQAFINNSSDFGDESNHTLDLDNDENGNGIIGVFELGNQEWGIHNKRLEYWECNNCGLSGNIPSEINGLHALASLDLSSNSLSGSIPENLGLMVHLNNINLSNNYLIGSVPSNTIARLFRYFQNNQVSFGNFSEVLNERLGDNSICDNTYGQYSLNNQKCEPAFEIIYPIDDMLLILNSTSDIIPVRILGLNFIINNVNDEIDGHFHYAVDGEDDLANAQYSSDFDLTFSYPGDHVVKMTLVNDDHSPFSPSTQKEVKFSVYHRDNIPELMSINEPDDKIISFDGEMIELVFSKELHPDSWWGIDVSNALGNIEYHWEASVGKDGDYRVVSIELDQLASGDQITLSLNPAEIRPNGDDDYTYQMSHLYPDTIWTWIYNVEYLGDYNHSGYEEDGIIIDHEDIDALVQHWGGNSDDDYRYELGPCWNGSSCQPQDAPYLHTDFDQIWDIEDLQSFMIMWNYAPPPSGGRVSGRKAMEEQGMQPIIQFENENLIMMLPKYDQSIRHIWFQVYIPEDSELIFNPASFSGQFDMALHREYPEESIVQWSLVNLEGELDLEDIMLGMVETATQSNQSLEVQYKLTSKEGILSSGTLALNYLPIPDEFNLSPAYPNPFNPVTTLQYALPIESNIVLSVHDIQGRLVTYLANELKSAGYYEAVWNASNNASGLYFIRLNAYDLDNTLRFNKLQKIMLVK